MEVNQLVAHYKANYERKVFMTRLSHARTVRYRPAREVRKVICISLSRRR